MRINRNSEYSGSKQDKEHLKFGLPPSDLDTNILKFNRINFNCYCCSHLVAGAKFRRKN